MTQMADCEHRWGRRVVVFCAASTVMAQITVCDPRMGRRVIVVMLDRP